MNRAAIKTQAKDRLRGRWGWAIALALVGDIMTVLVAGVTLGILGMIVSAGVVFTFLEFVDGTAPESLFNGIFSGFTGKRFMPTFLTNLLVVIFVYLWTLLLIVPGIVKALAYSQANYIVKDMTDAGREIGAVDAINASRELMVGHKAELFVLQLSFIGWGLLTVLTLGIGLLWLVPYMQTTYACYYRQLAGDRFRVSGENN
ncbi:DUF975 family protein [Lacticaseibacillus daqingensis]|uniref:DUF975 family protein n=1 Tax=Lacticaseibacillus daqingensis TaxID=2486014 RepID=UPI000F79FFEB|nr:DUF975 family protein [Lacticaseibacillus daqingensis]